MLRREYEKIVKKYNTIMNYDWNKFKKGDELYIMWCNKKILFGVIKENYGKGKFLFTFDDNSEGIFDFLELDSSYFDKVVLK